MQNETTNPEGREQQQSFILDGAPSSVWELFSNSHHIANWWGPEGFSNSIQQMDFRPGGEWLFTMHGPDGKSYPNRILFREIVPQQLLVHEHFEPNFITRISFRPEGGKTRVDWYKLYETRELFDLVEIRYRSSEGFQQTLQKLERYFDKMKQSRQ